MSLSGYGLNHNKEFVSIISKFSLQLTLKIKYLSLNKLVVHSNSANAWRASKYMSIGKDDL